MYGVVSNSLYIHSLFVLPHDNVKVVHATYNVKSHEPMVFCDQILYEWFGWL